MSCIFSHANQSFEEGGVNVFEPESPATAVHFLARERCLLPKDFWEPNVFCKVGAVALQFLV